jgi:hypothetical protein
VGDISYSNHNRKGVWKEVLQILQSPADRLQRKSEGEVDLKREIG